MRVTAYGAMLLALCAAVANAADPPVPTPAVPALEVGAAAEPRSFVVDGLARMTPKAGLGFHVATDGTSQLCVIYDATDGTPLFISDGRQTLVYDVPHGRLVRVPNSRANVRVDWDATKEKPLAFNLDVGMETNPAKLEKHRASFRIDRFIAATAATLARVGDDGKGVHTYAATRAGGGLVESVQVDPADPSWFRFASRGKGEADDFLAFTATFVGGEVPAAALTFPDVAALSKDVAVTELDGKGLMAMLAFLRDGRAWMAKLGISGGADIRAIAEQAMPGTDWADLARRDAALGSKYRAALAKQSIRYGDQKAGEESRPAQ